MARTVVIASAIALLLLGQGAEARAYGWPVKPFHEQHPIRGFFGDPRFDVDANGAVRGSFHFGIDIAAADGTPVYATLTGRVAIRHRGHDVVTIFGAHGRTFGYWHVVPAVKVGAQVVAYRDLIGYVAPPWAHVHFAEYRHGVPVNPLRRGALAPYRDTTTPVIEGLGVAWRGLAVVPHTPLHGCVPLAVAAHDDPTLPLPAPWSTLTAVPALVRWRIDDGAWHTALDVRLVLPRRGAYERTYADHTHQNRPGRRGHYLIYLIDCWAANVVSAGTHVLEVRVADSAGNTADARVRLVTG
jgi:hypothetical protein